MSCFDDDVVGDTWNPTKEEYDSFVNKLKPCPFCGEQSRIKMYDQGINDAYYFICQVCGGSNGCCQTKTEAIENWNTRK